MAADPERLGTFLGETGLRPDTIRAAAAEPGFALAVLEHAAADEERLRSLAAAAGRTPDDIEAARILLTPPDHDPFA